MPSTKCITIRQPEPHALVGLRFEVKGLVPKDWLLYGKYGLGVNWYDVRGNFINVCSPTAEIQPSVFNKLKKSLRFTCLVDLNPFQQSQHPRGLVLEFKCRDNESSFLPLIIEGLDRLGDSERKALVGMLDDAVKQVLRRTSIHEEYRKELAEVRVRSVMDEALLSELSGILEESDTALDPFTYSYEDTREREIADKYAEVLQWRGPILGGVVCRINGFEITVYSGDHRPQHFHIIHRGRGIDARFSYPQIELMSYKKSINKIGSAEVKKIQQCVRKPDNLAKMQGYFDKQVLT